MIDVQADEVGVVQQLIWCGGAPQPSPLLKAVCFGPLAGGHSMKREV